MAASPLPQVRSQAESRGCGGCQALLLPIPHTPGRVTLAASNTRCFQKGWWGWGHAFPETDSPGQAGLARCAHGLGIESAPAAL